MERGAGYYYQIRMRLKGQISQQRIALGKQLTRNQEDAWNLLNEFEQVIATVGKIERFLPQYEQFELTAEVRRILRLHGPGIRLTKDLPTDK